MEIGKKIKEIRLSNNLTQEEFGKKLSHNKSNISKWENNMLTPDIFTIKKISQEFNIDLNNLITNTEVVNSKKRLSNDNRFNWDKVNYTGAKNLQKSKKKWIALHIFWSVMATIGLLILFAPFSFLKENIHQKSVFLITGLIMFIVFGGIGGFVIGLSNRENMTIRYNVKIIFFNTHIEIVNKSSVSKKIIYFNDIVSLTHDSAGSSYEITISLMKNEIKLFDVDKSVLELINNIRKEVKT